MGEFRGIETYHCALLKHFVSVDCSDFATHRGARIELVSISSRNPYGIDDGEIDQLCMAGHLFGSRTGEL